MRSLEQKRFVERLLAYLPPSSALDTLLMQLRQALSERCPVAITAGYWRRALHPTGELHGAGSAQGLYLLLTATDDDDLPIPGEKFGFAALLERQAVLDFQLLVDRGRRILRCHFPLDPLTGLTELLALIQSQVPLPSPENPHGR